MRYEIWKREFEWKDEFHTEHCDKIRIVIQVFQSSCTDPSNLRTMPSSECLIFISIFAAILLRKKCCLEDTLVLMGADSTIDMISWRHCVLERLRNLLTNRNSRVRMWIQFYLNLDCELLNILLNFQNEDLSLLSSTLLLQSQNQSCQ